MEEQVMQKPGPGRKKWILGILICLLLVLTAVYVYAFRINQFSIQIRTNDASEMVVEYGSSYSEPGAAVYLQGSRFLREGRLLQDTPVEIVGSVDSGTVGSYTLTYQAEFMGLTATRQRIVHVTDTQYPVITLVSNSRLPEEGVPYEEEGYTARDNYDGDITHRVERQERYGVIVYSVSDSSGNMTTVERKIPYYDPIPPTVLLEGEMYHAITTGTVWKDPGVLAVDNVAGDLTDQVSITGEVDCYHPGTYLIDYTVSDTHGNKTVATRLVEVLAQPRPQTVMPEGKVIYLTFDDGPGPYTEQLLAVLEKYNVKATFFVTSTDYNHVMKQIVDQGHSIGIHSVTHNYAQIYANPEAYFADLMGMQEIIYRNTGVRTTLMRFPGGGSNLVSKRFCPGIMTLLTQAVQDAGFQYFDWNVSSGDAGETKKTAEVYRNVIAGVRSNRVSVVLQHDIHPYSVDAVEDIIVWGLENGYTFLPLEPNSPGFHHEVGN